MAGLPTLLPSRGAAQFGWPSYQVPPWTAPNTAPLPGFQWPPGYQGAQPQPQPQIAPVPGLPTATTASLMSVPGQAHQGQAQGPPPPQFQWPPNYQGYQQPAPGLLGPKIKPDDNISARAGGPSDAISAPITPKVKPGGPEARRTPIRDFFNERGIGGGQLREMFGDGQLLDRFNQVITENPAAISAFASGLTGGGTMLENMSNAFSGIAQGRVFDEQSAQQRQADEALTQLFQDPEFMALPDSMRNFLMSDLDASREFVMSQLMNQQGTADRPFEQDRNGVLRYLDNGQPVFPDVETQPEPGFDPIVTGETAAALGLDPTKAWQQAPDGQWKQAGASGVNVTTNVGGEGSRFGEQLAGALGDDFVDQRNAALQAVQSLTTAQLGRQLLDEGTIVGAGANFLLAMGGGLERLGIHLADDARANTRAYAALMAGEVGRMIQLFGAGTGLSDADREFARQMAGGEITMTKQALRRILDINERAARNLIEAYNRQAQQIERAPGYADNPIVPFPLTIDMPSGALSQPTAADPFGLGILGGGIEYLGVPGLEAR